MRDNRVFFPQEALDRWLAEAEVELSQNTLTLRRERRRYRLVEAARILAEVTGAADPHEIVGKVKSVAFLGELGGSPLGGSLVLAENAYDIVPGWLGVPVGPDGPDGGQREERDPSRVSRSTSLGSTPPRDEQLLASFLGRLS